MLSLCPEDDDEWFSLGLEKIVGAGDQTKFLVGRFHRLFNLSKNKYSTIKELGNWSDGVWQWNFSWRRGLRGRELVWLEELLSTVNCGRVIEGRPDKWVWVLGEERIYSVNSAYSFCRFMTWKLWSVTFNQSGPSLHLPM